jgi:hypothetical protein
MLFMHRVDRVVIEECTFDCTQSGESEIGAIAGGNNTAFLSQPFRTNVRVSGNRLLAAQGERGSEGVGLSAAERVELSANAIEGFGDDAVGLHGVSDFYVAGNRCATVDGRIYLGSSRRGSVLNNDVTRVAAAGGSWVNGGGLVWAVLEYAGGASAPSDLVIAGNRLTVPAGVTGHTYTIRLRGARRVECTGNEVTDLSGGWGIEPELQPQRLAGWSDPEGLDADGLARARSCRVTGNTLLGALAGRTPAVRVNGGDGDVGAGFPLDTVVIACVTD